jgi:hypothetical protein
MTWTLYKLGWGFLLSKISRPIYIVYEMRVAALSATDDERANVVAKLLMLMRILEPKPRRVTVMTSRVVWLLIAAVFVCGTTETIGAEMFAYPKNGQSHELQQADQQAGEAWADQQAGSSSPSAESSSSQEQRQGGPLRGEMRGRMIGEAAGNSSAGAMGGGMAGMIRRRMEQKRHEEQSGSGYQGSTDAHDRAYKACMEGRGYTVE